MQTDEPPPGGPGSARAAGRAPRGVERDQHHRAEHVRAVHAGHGGGVRHEPGGGAAHAQPLPCRLRARTARYRPALRPVRAPPDAALGPRGLHAGPAPVRRRVVHRIARRRAGAAGDRRLRRDRARARGDPRPPRARSGRQRDRSRHHADRAGLRLLSRHRRLAGRLARLAGELSRGGAVRRGRARVDLRAPARDPSRGVRPERAAYLCAAVAGSCDRPPSSATPCTGRARFRPGTP